MRRLAARLVVGAARAVARTAAAGGAPTDHPPLQRVGGVRRGVGRGAALAAIRSEAALRTPVTFAERVRYRMAHDRRPLLRTLTDKVAARDHIAAIVGPGMTAPLLAVADHPSELDRSALPREHVLKVAHGSGGSIMVTEDAPRGTVLPDPAALRTWRRFRVHPDDVDVARVDALLARWLAWDYAWRPTKPLVHQWAYEGLPRRIVAEELLRDASGGLPDDLKLYTVDGEIELIAHERVGPDGVRRTTGFTSDWSRPAGAAAAEVDVPRPVNLDAALELARRLGAGLDMVRVDLYDLGDRLVVGELTVYPMGGTSTRPPGHFSHAICPGWDPRRAVGIGDAVRTAG